LRLSAEIYGISIGVPLGRTKPPVWHRTMVKVCKPDCEGTIAGTRGNGEDAPKTDV